MRLKEFKTANVEPAYMEILRWRADQKYGRKGVGKRQPLGLNTNVNGVNGRGSPYGSPVPGDDNRGRSPQRFARGGGGSPRHNTIGSPLARVTEEGGNGSHNGRADGDAVRDFAAVGESSEVGKPEKLVDAPTPIEANNNAVRKNKLVDAPTPPVSRQVTRELPLTSLSRVSTQIGIGDDNGQTENMRGLGVNGMEDEMKNVTI